MPNTITLPMRTTLFLACLFFSASAHADWLKPEEKEFRREICLNGSWQFQPVAVPRSWMPNRGVPPELAMPKENGWEETNIKIPSAWNINTWGNGRNVGEGTSRPYFPDSVYYPSYPTHWDSVRMAWMKREFSLEQSDSPARYILHFEAVSGLCEVYVNGQKVGENFGRFLPFDFDVTKAVRFDETNELLVGVRSLRLYDKVSEKYPRMRTPYPPGSNMDNINGIWQDVYLLTLPAVRMEDVFVKPFVHKDTLEIEVTLKNDRDIPVTAFVEGKVNNSSLSFKRSDSVEIPPGETVTIGLSEKVSGQLKYWSMEEPNLYGLTLDILVDNRKADTKYTRFGWREFRIVGNELHLNGKPVKLFGDLLHPFGPFIGKPEYVKAWYTMIKDMHGNAARPHAQPHPRIFLELADEMGIAILDETALFGSSLQLNLEEDIAWDRFAEHYEKLILRDRNHPSVFGWSWGNELFATFIYDKNITPEQADIWWTQLAAYGKAGEKLDPTRNWFSCDGDEDVRGTSPVWNKHYGHGLPPDFPPEGIGKPLMIGEQGGTYYARPHQLVEFNGIRAYENYLGRNEALAIDVYQNIVQVAIPHLVFSHRLKRHGLVWSICRSDIPISAACPIKTTVCFSISLLPKTSRAFNLNVFRLMLRPLIPAGMSVCRCTSRCRCLKPKKRRKTRKDRNRGKHNENGAWDWGEISKVSIIPKCCFSVTPRGNSIVGLFPWEFRSICPAMI